MQEKRTKKRRKICLTLCFLLLLFLSNSMALNAIQPQFHSSGILLLKADNTMGRTYTGYYSVLCGVATWYYKYWFHIQCYCWYYKNSDYYATLPGYSGRTLVTAEKLARCIWNDTALGLGWVSYDVINKMTEVILLDKNISSYPVSSTYQWDPYIFWKWRSVYMESMYAENGNTTRINANCWGTADYLTRSFEWSDGYEYYYNRALNSGMSDWASRFPHIYLDGYFDWTYSMDNEFYYNDWRFHLLKWGEASTNPPIHMYINSFDIIRFSRPADSFNPELPSDWELVYDNINLKLNTHCVAYLCTDSNLKHWFYEKANFGETSKAPYRINAIGLDPYWEFANDYRSLFRHDYDYKQNMADSYDLNWANLDLTN